MGQPVTRIDASASNLVTFINIFAVPPGESEWFLRQWEDNAREMATQPGFIRARLYHSLTDNPEQKFINLAEWDSREALDQAMANPVGAEIRRALDDHHVITQPAVYQIALDVPPATAHDAAAGRAS